MNKFIKMDLALLAILCLSGCTDAMINSMINERMASHNQYQTEQQKIVYSNEVSQDFIDGLGDIALGFLTCDAIAKAAKPPLVVIRPLETEGEVSFDTAKYAETEWNILTKKAGGKVSFIDKETTGEVNYYLYGIISAVGNPTPPPNNNIERRQPSRYSTNSLMQQAAAKPGSTGSKAFKFTLILVDPHSNTTIWNDECGFTPTEMPIPQKPNKKRSE